MTESHRAPYISYGNTNWCNNHYEKETLASNVKYSYILWPATPYEKVLHRSEAEHTEE